MRPVVDAGIDESVEVVEAPLQRKIALEGAEIPFAKHSGGVPSLGEHLREQHLARVGPQDPLGADRVFVERITIAIVHPVVAKVVVGSVALRIAAGQQRDSGGRAHGEGRVIAGQPHSFRRECVKPGREDIAAAHRTKVHVALVVRDDQQDVGLAGRRHTRGQQREHGEVALHRAHCRQPAREAYRADSGTSLSRLPFP